MSYDFDTKADWLVRQWLFLGPAFPEKLDSPPEEVIPAAWDEFTVLLEDKGLAELQAMEDHLAGVGRAITFHVSLTDHAVLDGKARSAESTSGGAGGEAKGVFDPERLSDSERARLHELREWMGHEMTKRRMDDIQRGLDAQRRVYGRGAPEGDARSEADEEDGEAHEAERAATDHRRAGGRSLPPTGYEMETRLDDRARLASLYRLTDLRFSVLQGVMFYGTAFGIRSKWDNLSAETKRAVIEQATGRGRPKDIDKAPQEALDLLRVILDFTEDLEEGDRAWFTTKKEDRDSLCKAVKKAFPSLGGQSGAASRIKAVFGQVSERCDVSLPDAEENVPFYIECRDQIEEAAEAVERELL